MEPLDTLTPRPADSASRSGLVFLVLRAALVAATLLLIYYVASPGGKFFYQGF